MFGEIITTTGNDFRETMKLFEEDGVDFQRVRDYFKEIGFNFSAYGKPEQPDYFAEGSSPELNPLGNSEVPVYIAEGKLLEPDIYDTKLGVQLFVEVVPLGADRVYGKRSPLATDGDGNVRRVECVSVSGFIGSDPYINSWTLDDLRPRAKSQPLVDENLELLLQN